MELIIKVLFKRFYLINYLKVFYEEDVDLAIYNSIAPLLPETMGNRS